MLKTQFLKKNVVSFLQRTNFFCTFAVEIINH